MSHLERLVSFGSMIFHQVRTHFTEIESPVLFWAVLLIWILLVAYTCKCQLSLVRRRQLSNDVKSLQFEIRKTLKREQQAFDSLKKQLRKNMDECDSQSCKQWEIQSKDLCQIIHTFSVQLNKLEGRLVTFDRQIPRID